MSLLQRGVSLICRLLLLISHYAMPKFFTHLWRYERVGNLHSALGSFHSVLSWDRQQTTHNLVSLIDVTD